MGGIQCLQSCGDFLGDFQRVDGWQPIVRIATRVNVTLAAIHLARRNIKHIDGGRCIEVALAAGLDARVARALHERRQPSDLQVEPGIHQQVRLGQRHQQARFGLDEVRILIAARQRFHADVAAAHGVAFIGLALHQVSTGRLVDDGVRHAHGAGQVCEGLDRGDHADGFGTGGTREGENRQREQRRAEMFERARHRILLV